jgi:hypothetical protein
MRFAKGDGSRARASVTKSDKDISVGNVLKAMIVEYETLRTEFTQARTAVQNILQWTLATTGAIFAGGLIFLGQSDGLDRVHVTAFAVVFGIALPFLATFACWSWWGECWRVERILMYLRVLEADVNALVPAETPVMQWHRIVTWNADGVRGKFRRTNLSYVGSLGIFTGIIAISIGMSTTIVAQHAHAVGGYRWAMYSVGTFVIGLNLVVDVRNGTAILRSAGRSVLKDTGIRFRRP